MTRDIIDMVLVDGIYVPVNEIKKSLIERDRLVQMIDTELERRRDSERQGERYIDVYI